MSLNYFLNLVFFLSFLVSVHSACLRLQDILPRMEVDGQCYHILCKTNEIESCRPAKCPAPPVLVFVNGQATDFTVDMVDETDMEYPQQVWDFLKILQTTMERPFVATCDE